MFLCNTKEKRAGRIVILDDYHHFWYVWDMLWMNDLYWDKKYRSMLIIYKNDKSNYIGNYFFFSVTRMTFTSFCFRKMKILQQYLQCYVNVRLVLINGGFSFAWENIYYPYEPQTKIDNSESLAWNMCSFPCSTADNVLLLFMVLRCFSDYTLFFRVQVEKESTGSSPSCYPKHVSHVTRGIN